MRGRVLLIRPSSNWYEYSIGVLLWLNASKNVRTNFASLHNSVLQVCVSMGSVSRQRTVYLVLLGTHQKPAVSRPYHIKARLCARACVCWELFHFGRRPFGSVKRGSFVSRVSFFGCRPFGSDKQRDSHARKKPTCVHCACW
jgi:hypothetical protein